MQAGPGRGGQLPRPLVQLPATPETLGDITAHKLRQYDTLKILEGRDHSQCAAPGYAMWYLWAIRHLPGKPYTVPEFTAEHRWMM